MIKGTHDDHDDENVVEIADEKDGSNNRGIPEADDEAHHDQISKEFGDKYIGMKILLPNGESSSEAVIHSRKRIADGTRLIGKENPNPILDTRVYVVTFPDGSQDEYTANMIAESLYLSVEWNILNC